jgi:hypothetical protein
MSLRPFNLAALPTNRLERIWCTVLLVAIRDRATEVRFEPVEGDDGAVYEFWCKLVDGLYYELVPPPTAMVRQAIAFMRRVANLPAKSWHDQGFTTVGVDDARIDLFLVIGRTWHGERMTIYPSLNQRAVEEATSVLERWNSERNSDQDTIIDLAMTS